MWGRRACVPASTIDAGRRLAFAVRPIRQFHPRTDFVEQSSADIWRETCAAVREAVALAGVPADAIAALGFDATCSLVAVGADGGPVSVAEDGDPERDIIMWMDHRAADETAAINATRDPALAYVGGEVEHRDGACPRSCGCNGTARTAIGRRRASSTWPTTSSGAVAGPTRPASAR